FVANAEIATQLAEVGVILLMFGVGLQLHVEELLAVKKVAVPGAIVQSLVATALGAWIGHLFGWSWSAGIVFGMALSVASTVVLIRVLADNRDLHTPTGHIAIGWLVVEDLFTVVALVLMPVLFGDGESRTGLTGALALTTLKVGGLVLFTVVVGNRVIPRALDHVAATASRELFTLTVLVIALGIAVGSAKVFGVSMALGAFMAGLVVGRSDYSVRAASEALPMRDAFAVLFFVSVGMLVDPRQFWDAPGALLLTLAVVVIAKPLAAWAIVRAFGGSNRLAAPVATALAQIGEFSFVLASTSESLGILPKQAAGVLVGTSILSIALNPVLYGVARKLGARADAKRALAPDAVHEKPKPSRERDWAGIVGYGPTGQILHDILEQNHVDAAVIDLNLDAVRNAQQRGAHAVYGDAAQAEVLRAAGIEHAKALFLTSGNVTGAQDVIRVAKEVNAKLRVYVRTPFLAEVTALHSAGASSVIAAEGEVAVAMATELLESLGATPDQIDRERDRVYGALRERIQSA
ncbi:MAG TPA: cation:proton antiporter, partial [Polyangiales bacterium]